jgi:hypothetical protein
MAQGELVPLVLLPRYTTYAGLPTTGTPATAPLYFSTIAMDVTEYQNAIVNIWRGKLVGTTPGVAFTLEESTDQVNWTTCSGTTAAFDPGENAETQYTAILNKRWFRIIVLLGSTTTVVTCWAVGFLEQRLS